MRTQKEPVTLYLPQTMMIEIREIAQNTGVPISRIATDGMRKEINRWRALRILTGENKELNRDE